MQIKESSGSIAVLFANGQTIAGYKNGGYEVTKNGIKSVVIDKEG